MSCQNLSVAMAELCVEDDAEHVEECGDVFCVVLVGVTGDGKSTTGNVLCGRAAFAVSSGLSSASAECSHAAYLDMQGGCGIVRLIDTIGLQDTDLPAAEVMSRFSLFADHTPLGINCFLFIVRWGRFKPEHEAALEAFEANCGAHVLAHTLLVFTHCSVGEDALHRILEEDAPASLRRKLPLLRGAVGIDNAEPAAARATLQKKLEDVVDSERYGNEALAAARSRYDTRREEERAAFAAAVSDWRKGSGPVVIEREEGARAGPRANADTQSQEELT